MNENEVGWRFDNSYARLPELFFVKQHPVPVRSAKLVVFNQALAGALGLNASALSGQAGAEVFAGNSVPPGADPLAQAYAGHQFGHLNMLGDGRAILLGEQITPSGDRFDIQLKGSGQTPFSRRGDGRAAIGPMLREYIISEAMRGLGIPTTRSLAVVLTGEEIYRENPLQGAVLTRIAHSHLRVGTFVYALGVEGGGPESVRTLADYAMARHYPDLPRGDYLAFLRAVIDRQASLVAKWMQVGFIHGVMNTDNVAISGETIDYGPCAFLDAYSPTAVFSSIDRHGRYAFGNQPRIAAWNMARFAECLLPILDEDSARAEAKAKEAVEDFGLAFERHHMASMRGKLGLAQVQEGDVALVGEFLRALESEKADYTNTFRRFSVEDFRAPFFASAAFQAWHPTWLARRGREGVGPEEIRERMRAHNPVVIPRNHRVEDALAAADKGDLSVMEQLLAALQNPYEDSSAQTGYEQPPAGGGEGYRTFCGT